MKKEFEYSVGEMCALSIEHRPFDWIGIGAGPGNISTGTYLASEGGRTLIIERQRVGGHIADTPRLENLPGSLPQSGGEFREKLVDSYLRFKGVASEDGHPCAAFISGTAIYIEQSGPYKEVTVLDDNNEMHKIRALSLSIGTGLSWQPVQFDHQMEWDDLHYGPARALDIEGGRTILLYGGGNSSSQAAWSMPCQVHMVMRSGFKASKYLIDRVTTEDRIHLWHDTHIHRVVKNGNDNGSKYTAFVTNGKPGLQQIPFDEFLYTAGSIPNSEIARSSGITLTDKGYIEVDRGYNTSHRGVFAVGDVTGADRRLSIPIGHGAQVASNVWRYLASLDNS